MIKREMNILIEVVKILQPAYNATLLMDDALVSLLAPAVVSLHKKWQTMAGNAVYCSSLAQALLDSLQKRFSGLLDNLKPPKEQASNGSPSIIHSSGPFGDLLYPVASSPDPEFRLAWLDEWQDEWDANVKTRVTGGPVIILFKNWQL